MWSNSALEVRIDTLSQAVTDLTVKAAEEKADLTLVIAELRKEIKKLKKQLKAVDETLLPYKDPEPQSFFGNVPIHVTELEEDAKYKLDAGFINEEEFKDILEEAGLDPRIEIQLT